MLMDFPELSGNRSSSENNPPLFGTELHTHISWLASPFSPSSIPYLLVQLMAQDHGYAYVSLPLIPFPIPTGSFSENLQFNKAADTCVFEKPTLCSHHSIFHYHKNRLNRNSRSIVPRILHIQLAFQHEKRILLSNFQNPRFSKITANFESFTIRRKKFHCKKSQEFPQTTPKDSNFICDHN